MRKCKLIRKLKRKLKWFLGILSIPSLQINLYVRYVKLCEITLGEIGTRGRIKKHSLLSYNVPFSFLFPSSNVKAIKIRERNPAQEVAAGLARKHACDLTPRHDTSWSREQGNVRMRNVLDVRFPRAGRRCREKI